MMEDVRPPEQGERIAEEVTATVNEIYEKVSSVAWTGSLST